MPTLKKILAPIDFTDTSNHALDYAVDLAAVLGATVTVVHVYEPPVYSFADAVLVAPPELAAKISDKAQQLLDAAVNRHRKQCPTISGALVHGAAWEEIGRLAAEQNFDLIVMGTHGRRGLPRAILGSVAEKVLRTSTVPVLTVHAPNAVS
jgi:nucleotide-binding universal stress UspA family protein